MQTRATNGRPTIPADLARHLGTSTICVVDYRALGFERRFLSTIRGDSGRFGDIQNSPSPKLAANLANRRTTREHPYKFETSLRALAFERPLFQRLRPGKGFGAPEDISAQIGDIHDIDQAIGDARLRATLRTATEAPSSPARRNAPAPPRFAYGVASKPSANRVSGTFATNTPEPHST
jgi:hypothetical protein